MKQTSKEIKQHTHTGYDVPRNTPAVTVPLFNPILIPKLAVSNPNDSERFNNV